MKLSRLILAVSIYLVVFSGLNAVRADSTENYSFSGTLATSNNGTSAVNGEFTFDFTTGQVTSFNFTTPYDAVTPTYFIPKVFSTTCELTGNECGNGSYVGLMVLLQFESYHDDSGYTGENELDLYLEGGLSTSASSALFVDGVVDTLFKIGPTSELNCGELISGSASSPIDCNTGNQNFYESEFTSGVAVPTPEPTTSVFVGTGLLLLLGAKFRRFSS